MKRVLTILSACVFFAAQAQITVAPYTRELTCELGFTNELPWPQATSPCGKVKTKSSEEIFSGGCAGTLVRTYNFSDTCGNTAMAQQFIVLKDTEEPILHGIPKDIQVSDGVIPKAPDIVAIDNSMKMPAVIFTEEKTESQVIRRWTATDDCGNVARAEQRITTAGKSNF